MGGDLDAAEAMHRKSLEINEKSDRPERVATAHANLGNILYKRGLFSAAEGMLRKSLQMNRGSGG